MDFLKKITSDAPVSGRRGRSGLQLLSEIRPEPEGNLLAIRRELERLLGDAARFVDADSDVYMEFAQALRHGDNTAKTRRFSDVTEVSMKVTEKSGVAFEWIRQLHSLASQQMTLHLLLTVNC